MDIKCPPSLSTSGKLQTSGYRAESCIIPADGPSQRNLLFESFPARAFAPRPVSLAVFHLASDIDSRRMVVHSKAERDVRTATSCNTEPTGGGRPLLPRQHGRQKPEFGLHFDGIGHSEGVVTSAEKLDCFSMRGSDSPARVRNRFALTFTETSVPVLTDAMNNPVYFAATGVFTGAVSGVSEEHGQIEGH